MTENDEKKIDGILQSMRKPDGTDRLIKDVSGAIVLPVKVDKYYYGNYAYAYIVDANGKRVIEVNSIGPVHTPEEQEVLRRNAEFVVCAINAYGGTE